MSRKAPTRAEIAGNVRSWLILELGCRNNSTALRDLLGVRSRRAQGLYAGRVDYTMDELIRLAIALGHPLEAFYDRDFYMLKHRAGRIGRKLVECLQQGGRSDVEAEAAIEVAIASLRVGAVGHRSEVASS